MDDILDLNPPQPVAIEEKNSLPVNDPVAIEEKDSLPVNYQTITLSETNLIQLLQNVGDFFETVGRNSKKPAAALLLKGLKVNTASRISGLSKKYIHASRSPSYNPMESRLVIEAYTPNRSKQKVHELEVKATIAWAQGQLGQKSGQRTHETYFRYKTKSVWYHEMYQQG